MSSDMKRSKQRPWRQNDGRSSTQRGYGDAGWEAIRAAVLATEPACRRCGQPANQVDHAVPKHMGGTNHLLNLQPLCEACHRWKTAREKDGVVMSIGKKPRLFLDIDGTLVRFGGDVANDQVRAFAVKWRANHPAGQIILWSKRGAAYAASKRWALGLPHTVADKRELRPESGWLFVDDSPLASWAPLCIHPSRLHVRPSRLRPVEPHPGAIR